MDGAFDLVVEARPTAPGMKLVFRAVERRVTATTGVRAVFFAVVVFARARVLGTFVQDDAGLLFGQVVIAIGHFAAPLDSSVGPAVYSTLRSQLENTSGSSHIQMGSGWVQHLTL